MDSYGWKVKLWKFNFSNIDEQRKKYEDWISKWQRKYQIRKIFVNNAFSLEYRILK